jgi:hypothetical protein
MWALFRNCRRAAYWRYARELVPTADDAENLRFGHLIHESLEIWHKTLSIRDVMFHIEEATVKRSWDPEAKRFWFLSRAMMRGYAAIHPTNEFEVVALERIFEAPITNPETCAASKTFTINGKADGLVRKPDGLWLLEHKTASYVDAGYIEKLWCDFQITLYSEVLERILGEPIRGVVYNILVKSKLIQSMGETEAEFIARSQELAKNNKSGKSSAKRRISESDEEYESRVNAKHMDPAMYHREEILISRDSFANLRSELWELTQAWLDCRRRDTWYQNTSFCFQWSRPCPYFPICRSNNSPNVVDNFYIHKDPFSELTSDIPTSQSLF